MSLKTFFNRPIFQCLIVGSALLFSTHAFAAVTKTVKGSAAVTRTVTGSAPTGKCESYCATCADCSLPKTKCQTRCSAICATDQASKKSTSDKCNEFCSIPGGTRRCVPHCTEIINTGVCGK